jgi:hypothetical protein
MSNDANAEQRVANLDDLRPVPRHIPAPPLHPVRSTQSTRPPTLIGEAPDTRS